MNTRLHSELKRRTQERLRFYYMEIGSAIRKKRIEHNMTQEDLSKGICSNTYLSKIEHNAIAVNKDSLYMIMERIQLPSDAVVFPDELLSYLDKTVHLFFMKDVEGLRTLYLDSMQYEFGILIDIARLGFLLSENDLSEAAKLHEDLHRYLVSVEDSVFTVFVMFSIFYHIQQNDFHTAKQILDMTIPFQTLNQELFAMFQEASFIIHGRLFQFNLARDAYDKASAIFSSNLSMNRLKEMHFYLNLFKIHEGSPFEMNDDHELFSCVDTSLRNEYRLCAAYRDETLMDRLEKIQTDESYYLESLFLRGWITLRKKDFLNFELILKTLEEQEAFQHSPIPFSLMLLHAKRKEEMLLKDLLIQKLLGLAMDKQNIFFMNEVISAISQILSNNKRYKDAITYRMKLDKSIQKMRY